MIGFFIIIHKHMCILMLMTIYECNFFYIHKTKQKHVYRGFLEYVVNAHDSWFFMKGAPAGFGPRYYLDRISPSPLILLIIDNV